MNIEHLGYNRLIRPLIFAYSTMQLITKLLNQFWGNQTRCGCMQSSVQTLRITVSDAASTDSIIKIY